MNKKISKILCCGVCLTMAAVFTAGCTGGAGTGAGENPETRPFVMAIGATDGNFNPFFATAQYDTEVASLTQLSMLSADENGNITCGENEPSVVLDYTETMYDENGIVTDKGDMNGKTVYKFVIKNGIKFSDGTDLTIKDVLFNMYVYLDPVYFGSSTMYSTDIVGLAAYRNQDELADSGSSDIQSNFLPDAQSRVNYLMEYLKDGTVNSQTTEEELNADIETVKKLYKEEASSDWTVNYGSVDSYKDEYRFTTNWEVYYFSEGLISVLWELNEGGNRVDKKDENGKYLTSLDEDGNNLRELMDAAKSDETLISAAMTKYNCSREEAIGYVERDTAIETVYEAKTATNSTIRTIFTEGWQTANNALDQFAKEAMTAHFDQIRDENEGKLLVENIKGIYTEQTSQFNGKNLGGTHDVLVVEVNGVDPKAIWNMAFAVAPASYYSGEYKGVDYRNIDISKNQFGVCFGDSNFFDSVLNNTNKSKCPVGAGVYQASTANGGTTRNGDAFHNNKVSYYVRNDYFETSGKGISNAKIKYVRYREVEDASLVQTLKTGEVDYGEPSCTKENLDSINDKSARVDLANTQYKTAGYGYVGINAKFIPDHEVRVAIMKSMNIMEAVGYYTEQYASPLYRPVSTTNWVNGYLGLEGETQQYYEYEADSNAIWQSLYDKGWRKNASGVGEKDGRKLKYTFTIAGGTEDHPAFNMFRNAANRLNKAGFDITVMTSTDALKSLATGALTVWAAAYTSPVDPDLYQVYHMDSKATSVKNWGYDVIKKNTNNLYDYELGILGSLSENIVAARQTLSQETRGEIYKTCFEQIMELAIQLPTYQRNDLAVYNRKLLDGSTINRNATSYAGVLNRIWEVNYSKK